VCVRKFVTGQTCYITAAFLVRKGGIVGGGSHAQDLNHFISCNQEDCMQLSACRFLPVRRTKI